MTTLVLKLLLPDEEYRILDAYFKGGTPYDLDELYDAIGVPEDPTPERNDVAVAHILLNTIQKKLPNWGVVREDGTVELGRKPHFRHKDARLDFIPHLVCTINWADSGPGFSWPEAYYITHLPSFGKYIVTASRDSEACHGCIDHAIGFADDSLDPVEAARDIICAYWDSQVYDGDQGRWVYLFDEGLIDAATANEWADKVWISNYADEEEWDDE